MTVHDAKAVRRNAGWYLWVATCPCGWGINANGREDAEQRAQAHNNEQAKPAVERALAAAKHLRCDCWEGDEFTDSCPRCRIIEALGDAS